MNYSQEVIYILDIFNEVLDRLNKINLLENKDFKINNKVFSEHWIRISLNKTNSIPIYIEIMSSEMRIDLDIAEELFQININDIKKDRESIITLIKMILTSTIKMEYCGKSYRKFYFIDYKNNILDIIEYYKNTLFSLKLNCKEKIYLPIYCHVLVSK